MYARGSADALLSFSSFQSKYVSLLKAPLKECVHHWGRMTFMSFLEIRLIPFANCVIQGHSWAGHAQLRGSQPRGHLGPEDQPVLGSLGLGEESSS